MPKVVLLLLTYASTLIQEHQTAVTSGLTGAGSTSDCADDNTYGVQAPVEEYVMFHTENVLTIACATSFQSFLTPFELMMTPFDELSDSSSNGVYLNYPS